MNESAEVINKGEPIIINSHNSTIKVTCPAIAFTENGIYKVVVEDRRITVLKEN